MSEPNKPMRLPLPIKRSAAARSLLGDPPGNEETNHAKIVAWLTVESVRRLLLLLERYGINKDDPERWFLLAFNLAREHERGFAVEFGEKRKGRPPEWDGVRLAALYRDATRLRITRRREGKGYKLESVFNDLSKRDPWKDIDIKTLENRFREAKKSEFVIMANSKMKHHPEAANVMLDLLLDTQKARKNNPQ